LDRPAKKKNMTTSRKRESPGGGFPTNLQGWGDGKTRKKKPPPHSRREEEQIAKRGKSEREKQKEVVGAENGPVLQVDSLLKWETGHVVGSRGKSAHIVGKGGRKLRLWKSWDRVYRRSKSNTIGFGEEH